MKQISINGINVDVNKINYIDIIEISDENDKMYITFHLVDGIIKTISEDPTDVDGWDRITDVGSTKGTKDQLKDILNEFCQDWKVME